MVAEQGDEVVERAGSLRQCSISRCTNSNSPSSGLASVSAIFPPAMISGGYGRRAAEITHAHRKDTLIGMSSGRESEQLSIDLILESRTHAVRSAWNDFQCS